MKYLLPALMLLATPAFAQEQPGMNAELLAAIQALSQKIDQLNPPAVQSIPVPVPITAGELGCDGLIQSVQSDPCAPALDLGSLSLASDPCATADLNRALALAAIYRTIQTREPLRVERVSAPPSFEWNIGWWDILKWKHSQNNYRSIGPYLIETKPRLLGLLGTRIRVYD